MRPPRINSLGFGKRKLLDGYSGAGFEQIWPFAGEARKLRSSSTGTPPPGFKELENAK
jgi:hypothetical protein